MIAFMTMRPRYTLRRRGGRIQVHIIGQHKSRKLVQLTPLPIAKLGKHRNNLVLLSHQKLATREIQREAPGIRYGIAKIVGRMQ